MKKALIIASCLMIAGVLLCFTAMLLIDFDFKKLDTNTYTTNTYEFTELINDIDLDCNTADIKILPSDSDKTKVVILENEDDTHTTKVVGNKLSIQNEDDEWYENIFFGFNFRSPEITIYLPQKNYSSIYVDNSTGDLNIKEINFDTIEIEVSTGDTTLNNITTSHIEIESSTGSVNLTKISAYKDINIETSTGDIELNSAVCNGSLELETSTGDIAFDRSDAASINCETSTGDITGTLLSDKSFYTETSTGDISVPHTTGNKCELETSTGDIKISIAK